MLLFYNSDMLNMVKSYIKYYIQNTLYIILKKISIIREKNLMKNSIVILTNFCYNLIKPG